MDGLSPHALSLENAVRIFSRIPGEPITLDMLEADIFAGAPTNIDGTLNIVHYAAWLLRESSSRES